MRLAYVAATRAQERLLLSGVVTDSRLNAGVGKPGTLVASRLALDWLDGKLDGEDPWSCRPLRRGLASTRSSGRRRCGCR